LEAVGVEYFLVEGVEGFINAEDGGVDLRRRCGEEGGRWEFSGIGFADGMRVGDGVLEAVGKGVGGGGWRGFRVVFRGGGW